MGMVISDGLAIWAGRIMGRQLPERAIKIGAAIIFVGFGLFYSMKGAMDLWEKYWPGFS
jgi:putative Ca2+/H+ antiporter (TMEM165/GDT1 family)